MSVFYENKGRYRCRVTGQGLGKSKEKQTPFFFIKFEPMKLIVGPEQEEDVTRAYERTAIRYMTDKTLDYAIEDMLALGFEIDAPSQIDLDHPRSHSIVGQIVEMYCQHENKDGQDYERWSVAKQGGGGMVVEPIDKSASKALDAMFGSSLKTKRKMADAEKPKPRQAVASSTALDDDETPF